MTIRQKLFWGFGSGIFIIALIGFGGLAVRSIITADLDTIVDYEAPSISDLLEFKIHAVEVKEEALSLTIFTVYGIGGQAAIEAERAELAQTDSDFNQFLINYQSHITPGDAFETSNLEVIKSQWFDFQASVSKLLAGESQDNSKDEILQANNEIDDSSAGLIATIDQALAQQRSDLDAASRSADSIAAVAFAATVAVVILAILLGILVGYAISRDILSKLSKFKESAKKIEGGNLNELVPIKSNDELGDLAKSFNAMTMALKYSYQTLEQEVQDRTKELEDLSKRNEILLQSIGDGVVSIDKDWKITTFNHVAEELTGWKKDEVMGKPFREHVRFIKARDRSENIVFIEETLLYGKVKFMANHTLLIRKNGEELTVGDSAAPIFDEDKKITGVIIVFRDLSKEASSQSLKTDFQYASHQMRTPVTKIIWDLEAIADAGSAEKREEFINNALDSARSISKMSDQLLAVAEIDQNIVIPNFEITNLSEVIMSVLTKMDFAVKRKKIKMSYNAVAPISLEADKKLLERALLEVIDNAIKYNKDEGSVTVDAKQQKDGILIEVRDTGIGITDEQQPLVFTKFFRGTNYDTSKISGAGLGLFIAKAYVEFMKGKIWFKSEPDKGTSFFVLVPKART